MRPRPKLGAKARSGADRSRLLLVAGPSGVGKTSIIRELVSHHADFTAFPLYTTRPLRGVEAERIHVTPNELKALNNSGEVLCIIEAYGASYGIPRSAFLDARRSGKHVVIDCPVQKLSDVRKTLSNDVFSVYLQPPTTQELRRRLIERGERDEVRFLEALSELRQVFTGTFDRVIDARVVNETGSLSGVVETVRDGYLKSLQHAGQP